MGKPLDFTFYNPDQLGDEDFLRGFVARQDLADKILARLGEIKPRGLAQHRLIVGQRGMGKTSLLRRIALGVRDEPRLAAVLLPLSFREEQYNVHNLHVFWCNCLDALGDWLEKAGRRDEAEHLDRDVATLNAQEDDDEGSKALELFRGWMKREKRRPLLLLDNLDIIFNGLKDKQWSLRRVLQQAGGIVVVGASSAALEAAADREGAFYDFFQVDVLAKLEHHEILLCLRHMARQRAEAGLKVLQILDRDPARVHVLYDLTGGNPRTLAMLYLVLETSGDEGVMRDLERLLDQATPLYKARVEELAPQARVVFDALALSWDPATAAGLAAVTGLEVSAVSTQLDRLFRDGIAEKTSLSSTSRTGFQVAERFFNIWYLMRHSPRRQRLRLRWLTEMLRQIYSPRELRQRAAGFLGGAESDRFSRAAYCLALSDAVDDWDLRAALRGSVRRHPSRLAEDAVWLEDDFSLSMSVPNSVHKPAVASSGTAVETYRKAIDQDPKDPGLWNGLGRLLLKLPERSGDAEVALCKAIELDPQYVEPWINLGVLFEGPSERYAEAEAAYRKAIELAPNLELPWSSLGRLLGGPLERYAEAEAAYRKAIELAPNLAGLWNNLGLLLADSLERHAEAENAYHQAIKLDPKFAVPWSNLGLLLGGPLERYAEAETAYRKAIELAPTLAAPWNNLSFLLGGPLERYAEAEAAYRKAIELAPGHAKPWYGLGLLLAGPLERHVEAEAAYRKAIELDPKSAWHWHSLGNLLAGPLERPTEAEAAFLKAIELNPKSALLWNNIGDLLAGSLKRPVEAEAAYLRAIELAPKVAWPWHNLGVLLEVLLKRPVEAEAAYRRAIQLNPKHGGYWHHLGVVLTGALERHTEAETAFRNAIELKPKSPRFWHDLGVLLEGPLKRPVEAEAAFLRAIELNPKFGGYWHHLGGVLAGPLERHTEAEAAIRRAIELDPELGSAWNSLGNLLADHLFRLDEAEYAYRTAMRIAPESYYPVGNLAYLLLRRDGSTADAESIYQTALAALPPHGAGLLRAFHALAADNFGAAVAELQAVLEEGHEQLFTTFRDDLLRIVQFANDRGYGDKLLSWLESSGFGARYWPLQAAFDAYLHGEERLMDVNPEVRNGARRLLAEMTRRPKGTLDEVPQPGQKTPHSRRKTRDTVVSGSPTRSDGTRRRRGP